jgi:hypothetical protein
MEDALGQEPIFCIVAMRSPVHNGYREVSPGLKPGRGVTLTTHPHLVPRSRMSRSYILSPQSALVACSGTALALQR